MLCRVSNLWLLTTYPGSVASHQTTHCPLCLPDVSTGQTSGRAGPPPSPLAPSRRGSPRHRANQRQRKGPDEGLFRPGCPIYSLRLPADQIQQHSSHLAAAIATANAVPDRHTASSSAGMIVFGVFFATEYMHVLLQYMSRVSHAPSWHIAVVS